MADFGGALKEEVTRLARKALKSELDALRKASANYRHEIASLKRKLADLEKGSTKLAKRVRTAEVVAQDAAGGDESKSNVRYSVKGLRSMRAKLGLSAEDFGKLVGVSGQSIYLWEAEKTKPRQKQIEALAALRGIGKREAMARLEGAKKDG